MSTNVSCSHIKITGVRCGSPALKGEQFCYFHQSAIRGVRRPKQSRLHPIALIEDEESIQYALMEVINALMKNTIDLKRATLILRALHIAVKNASRVKYNLGAKDMVTKIPDYSAPTDEHDELARESDFPAVAANPSLPIGPEGPHYWELQAEAARRQAREETIRFAAEAKSREEARQRFAQERAAEAKARAETARAETTAVNARPSASADPLVRPATPSEVTASVPAADTTTTPTPTAVPPHDFKKPSPSTPQQPIAATRVPATGTSQRKPPTPVKTTPRQKNSAHAPRHG